MAVDLIFGGPLGLATPDLLFGGTGYGPVDDASFGGTFRFGGQITAVELKLANFGGQVRFGGTILADISVGAQFGGQARFGGVIQAGLSFPPASAIFGGIARFTGAVQANYYPTNGSYILGQIRWAGPILANYGIESPAAFGGQIRWRGQVFIRLLPTLPVQGEQGVLASSWTDSSLSPDILAEVMAAVASGRALWAPAHEGLIGACAAGPGLAFEAAPSILSAPAAAHTLGATVVLVYPD